MHIVVDAHETLFSQGAPSPDGRAGIGLIVHDEPFQSSASVWEPVLVIPTAMHEVEDLQETDQNSLFAPAGFGVVWSFQLEPFQVSEIGAEFGGLKRASSPTAMQKVGDVHETARNSLGLGLVAAPLALPVAAAAVAAVPSASTPPATRRLATRQA
jgi:hypothetical protein